MSIAQPSLGAAAIAHPAGSAFTIRVPRNRETIVAPETPLVPLAR